MKLTKAFFGVPAGAVYPKDYVAGDECPPELVEAAASVGAVGKAEAEKFLADVSAKAEKARAAAANKARAAAPENK